MTSPAKLREHEVLAAQLSALCANSKRSSFCRGAEAALRWLTEGGAGPLSGALTGRPVMFRAIVRELSAAEALIYGRPSDQRRYAEGVEYALMWAQFVTPTPPAHSDPSSAPAVNSRRTGIGG